MTTPQVTKNLHNTPIFAYARRSTTNKQELSIGKQHDNIDLIIKDNWFDKEKVMSFVESRSAYNGIKQKNWKIIRKRAEFTKLLEAIDKSKTPSILIAYNSSRLSRNEVDNLEITKRLFWMYGSPVKIEKIIFYGGTVWDCNSDKIVIWNELIKNYQDSITTARESWKWVEAQWRNWWFPITPPSCLKKIKKDCEVYLEENEKMPFIRHAFEMKADWKTLKEI